jgi:hypothetical protein
MTYFLPLYSLYLRLIFFGCVGVIVDGVFLTLDRANSSESRAASGAFRDQADDFVNS